MSQFTGVFRGKAAQVNGLSITAFVPQVFGEQPIMISDFIGNIPTLPEMGWVLFQAGNPEFPVWIGRLAAADGGGGDGTGGTNEVWIGPSDPIPANPTVELWFDQDAASGVLGSVPAGGTSGQVLAKNTGTDFDTGWTTLTRILSGLEVNKPGVPAAGTRYFATDTWRDWVFDGTGWTIMLEPSQTFNTVIASTTGAITTVGAKAFTYRRSGGSLFWDCDVTITTNGTGAGTLTMTLPFAIAGTKQFIGNGREDTAGLASQVSAVGTTATVLTYANAYPVASGSRLLLSGRYRMQTGYS